MGFRCGVYSSPYIDRIWGIWGSNYDIGQLHIISTSGGLEEFVFVVDSWTQYLLLNSSSELLMDLI